MVHLAWPSVNVKVDYTTPALESPVDWTDLSSRARRVQIHQGRQRLLAQTEVGRASVRMGNSDRALDPTLHPEVRPGVHLWVYATVAGTPVDLFRGFVRSWGQEWPVKKDAVSVVTAEDAFALLSRFELEGDAVSAMLTGAHLRTVLDLYGWPGDADVPPGSTWWILGDAASQLGTNTFLGETLSSFDDGKSTIMALNLEGNLLAHLLNVAETTERGTFYVGPSGNLVFRERPSVFAPSLGTWGDGAGELPYTELVMSYNDEEIFNDIRLTRRGDVTSSVATDAASVADYGPRTLAINDTLFSTVAQQDTAAGDLLLRHEQPLLHPVQLVMRPPTSVSSLWSAVLGMQLGSKITVRRRPPGGGAMIEVDCLILGVTYDIASSERSWQITWDLAPADPILEAWYLGRIGMSELGATTVLA